MKMRCNNFNMTEQGANDVTTMNFVSQDRDGKPFQEGMTGSVSVTKNGTETLNMSANFGGPGVDKITSVTVDLSSAKKTGDIIEVDLGGTQ